MGIQESTSETDTEIEFGNGDSGDNISDGDAESFDLHRGFFRTTSMVKWRKLGPMCEVVSLGA